MAFDSDFSNFVDIFDLNKKCFFNHIWFKNSKINSIDPLN